MSKNNFIENTYKSFRTYLDQVYLARKKSNNLIPLSIGYPIGNILKLSNQVLDALSVSKGGKEIERIGYGWNFSTTELKEKIAFYENAKSNTNYTSENIALTAGGTHAINKFCEFLTNKEDGNDYEIIVASPALYKIFGLIRKYTNIIPVTGKEKNNFVPTYDEIVQAVTERTRLIFISNPSNPAYVFYPSEQLKKIIDFAEKKNIYIMLDEVGDAYRYKEYTYPSNINSQFVVKVNSAAKSMLMAEYSLGYMISTPDVISSIHKSVGDEMGHIPFAGCRGWIKGLELEAERLKENKNNEYYQIYSQNLKLLKDNRDYVINELNKYQCVKNIITPDACFSLIFNINSQKFKDDIELFKNILNAQKVSLVPGSGFGIETNELYLRLTFAINTDTLKKGINRITNYINEAK